MVYVIAAIEIKPGKRQEYLNLFNAMVPTVRAEQGCIEYGPAVDAETDIGRQMPPRPDVVTVMEKWDSPAALKAHLAAPHMAELKEAVKDVVVGLELQILDPAGPV